VRLVAGCLLVVLGLVGGGWYLWEYVGTTVVAHHRQRQILADLHARWDSDGARDPTARGVRGPWGTAYAIVRIPAFGDDYEVPVLEGAGDEQFATGFGHFPGTAAPGEAGNLVLGAHRVTHGEPLRHLPDLLPGDEVIVETAAATYTYALDSNTLEVDDTDDWPLTDPLEVPAADAALAPEGPATITLVTCAALFHTDERSVAFGHLVHTEARGG
jgi:sortase A